MEWEFSQLLFTSVLNYDMTRWSSWGAEVRHLYEARMSDYLKKIIHEQSLITPAKYWS